MTSRCLPGASPSLLPLSSEDDPASPEGSLPALDEAPLLDDLDDASAAELLPGEPLEDDALPSDEDDEPWGAIEGLSDDEPPADEEEDVDSPREELLLPELPILEDEPGDPGEPFPPLATFLHEDDADEEEEPPPDEALH